MGFKSPPFFIFRIPFKYGFLRTVTNRSRAVITRESEEKRYSRRRCTILPFLKRKSGLERDWKAKKERKKGKWKKVSLEDFLNPFFHFLPFSSLLFKDQYEKKEKRKECAHTSFNETNLPIDSGKEEFPQSATKTLQTRNKRCTERSQERKRHTHTK